MKRSVSKLMLITPILLAYNCRKEEVFKVKKTWQIQRYKNVNLWHNESAQNEKKKEMQENKKLFTLDTAAYLKFTI